MQVTNRKSAHLVEYEITSQCLAPKLVISVLIPVLLASFYHRAWWVFIPALLVVLFLRTKITEGVLIIPGVGLQTCRLGQFRLLSDYRRFFPKNTLRVTLINEVFEGFVVNYVLQTFIEDLDSSARASSRQLTPVKGGECAPKYTNIYLVLPTMRPKLQVLREIKDQINNI